MIMIARKFTASFFALFLRVFKGRFTIAAKQHMAIAEIYEGSVIDLEKVRAGDNTVSWILAGI